MAKRRYQCLRDRAWQGALMLVLFLLALPVLGAEKEEKNIIKSIKTVEGGVEIELFSTREFTPRNALVMLRIGESEFTQSRSPEDGSLNTLIFLIPANAFSTQTDSGEDVWVDYGEQPGEKWYFGKLDKGLLDKK